MVVRYRPIDSLAEQSTNGLMPGTRFESIMGRRFSTTAELERAFDQLAPNAVVTGKVYGYDLKYDIVVRLKDLQRAGLSQGIASSLALGLRSEGEHLWAFLADAVPFGAHPGTTSILKVAGRNAADLDSWKLAIEESRERRSPVALEIIDANQLNDPHQELDAGTFEGRKRWGILFNPRVPVPARYSGNFFDLPLTIFGVAARFAGLGGTRWRDLIVRFPSYPMRWYEIPSGALTHASFWAHAFGAAFLVAGLLFLLFGGLALKLCIRPVWAIVAVALVTELFLWKELLWIPHV